MNDINPFSSQGVQARSKANPREGDQVPVLWLCLSPGHGGALHHKATDRVRQGCGGYGGAVSLSMLY